ncbi:MAG: hypothetical protein R3E95_11515 [Thiolinea sp.]
MKMTPRPALLVWITLALCGLSACDPRETTMPTPDFLLRYQTSAEASYTDIRIEHGQLTHTFFTDRNHRCAQWFQSSPCWNQNDLQTLSRPLTEAELQTLWTDIQSSGVLELEEQYGESNPRSRAYTETLRVRTAADEPEQVIRYRSTPSAAAKPAAFAQLETSLQALARTLPP